MALKTKIPARDCASRVIAGIVCLLGMSTALGAEIYSRPAARDFPANVYWGDTHLHTNMSVDANGMGNQLLSPDDAYRFAKGETVPPRLSRPHDGAGRYDDANRASSRQAPQGCLAPLSQMHPGAARVD